jgi:hypothetical protein
LERLCFASVAKWYDDEDLLTDYEGWDEPTSRGEIHINLCDLRKIREGESDP